MPAPLLVFDLDGTLVDSAPDLLATLDVVLPRHGFLADPDPALRDGIGHGARHLIEFALHRQGAAPGTAVVDAIHADFIELYVAHIADRTRAYPGLVALLDRFDAEGWRFAVCTNKLVGMSRALLERLDLAPRFAAICGGDSFAVRKPDPGHLLGTIAAASGDPACAVMVGDSRTDLDTARAAGIPFVGVTFGYTPVPMAVLGPDLLLDSFEALDPSRARALLDAAASGEKRNFTSAPEPARA